MITMKGKYNSANIMLEEIDEATRGQIQDFLNNPSFNDSYIAIMPDCHKGAGSCIGFTMQMNSRIIPDIVGVDIGCGMFSVNFGKSKFNPKTFDEFVKKTIPMGFSVHGKSQVSWGDWVDAEAIADRLKMDKGRVELSLGTLGGGNHFIEAGYDSNKDLWVTVHSGSRNFGMQIAKHHGQVAKELCEKWGAETRGIPFLPSDSKEGELYIHDMEVAQKYAALNRQIMLENISAYFGKSIFDLDKIESVHNFIDHKGMIRKGATSALEGERVLIPFNMRDGLAICTGKGNKKWNYSAPHGAGRILSRSKAKETLDVDYFQEDMKQAGVYTTTANASTLDESPDAYKDYKVILKAIEETVDVVDMVKPIYNCKAGGE